MGKGLGLMLILTAPVVCLQAGAAEPGPEAPRDYICPNPKTGIRAQGGPMYEPIVRTVPLQGVIHDSVFERLRSGDTPYVSASLFDLSKRIDARRQEKKEEFDRLKRTAGIEPREEDVVERKITRWTEKKEWCDDNSHETSLENPVTDDRASDAS